MTAPALTDTPAPDHTQSYWRGLSQIPPTWDRSVVTVGVFDGMHRGHVRLLDRATTLGRHRGVPVVLTTFDPHPASVAGRPRDTTPVATLDRRAELARYHGADAVLVLPFDEHMAATSAHAFIHDILVGALRATDVLIGENFRFGHRGAGDPDMLERFGRHYGYTTHAVPLLPGCSSTRVRELLTAGDLASATATLGRPHRVTGHARHGLVDVGNALLPPAGRYRVRVGTTETHAEIHRHTVSLDMITHGETHIDLLGPVLSITDEQQ